MKKAQMKRAGVGSAKVKDLKKPFDFCCDINHQDPETRYDMRVPPFETSLTDMAPNKDGPDLKFRIEDVGKPTSPALRSGTHKVKSSTNLGRCKRCRGPLRWYIEEEVALARDIVANEQAIEYNRQRKARLSRKRAKLKKAKKRKNPTDASRAMEKEHDEEVNDGDGEDRKFI